MHARYCPHCQRRMFDTRPDTRTCVVCGGPVSSPSGAGRPRTVHPECRAARKKFYDETARQRARAKRGES